MCVVNFARFVDEKLESFRKFINFLYAKYLERKFIKNFYKHMKSYQREDINLYETSLIEMVKIVHNIPKTLIFCRDERVLDIVESMDIVLELVELLQNSTICREDRIDILEDFYKILIQKGV